MRSILVNPVRDCLLDCCSLFVFIHIQVGVSIHWTGLLDWNTGLSFFLFWASFCAYF